MTSTQRHRVLVLSSLLCILWSSAGGQEGSRYASRNETRVCPVTRACRDFKECFDDDTNSASEDCFDDFCQSCPQPMLCQRDCDSFLNMLQTCFQNLDFFSCACGWLAASLRTLELDVTDPCVTAAAELLPDYVVNFLGQNFDINIRSTSNCSCDEFCQDLPSLYTSCNGEVDESEDILKYCLYSSGPGCNLMLFSSSPPNYCSYSRNLPLCEDLCGLADDEIPHGCASCRDRFCLSFLENSIELLAEGEYNETIENSVAMNLNQFIDLLEIEEIAQGIHNILMSLNQRQGRLSFKTSDFILKTYETIFDDDFSQEWEERATGNALDIFNGVDGMATELGELFKSETRTEPYSFSGQNIVYNIERRQVEEGEDDFEFTPSRNNSNNASKVSVHFPHQALCEEEEGCSVILGVSVADNLANYIHEEIADNSTQLAAASGLLSVYVFTSQFDEEDNRLKDYPIRMTFTPTLPTVNATSTTNATLSLQCNFLDSNASTWSTKGVDTVMLDNGDVMCITKHLTSFAILLSTTGTVTRSDPEKYALKYVSYIGCGISIVCLVLTLIVLAILRNRLQKGVLLYIHFNFCLALLLALVVFVAGVETATGLPVLCTIIAALIQYLFLCVFCWMLCEGIMLYLLVVRVFGNLAKKWYLLLILGWGIPLPIVAISAGLLRRDYGTDDYCWIEADPSEAAIWTFVGPIMLIIAINAVILVLTIRAIVCGRKKGGAETEVKAYQLAASCVKGSVVLLPLLGVTWVFGLFAVNSNTTVFAWLFTICNSLQGLFIFVLHVVRNEVFLKALKHHCRSCDTNCPCCSSNVRRKSITSHIELSTKEACQLQHQDPKQDKTIATEEDFIS